jgi:hypothetical protein
MQLALGTDSSGDYLELSELPNEVRCWHMSAVARRRQLCPCPGL